MMDTTTWSNLGQQLSQTLGRILSDPQAGIQITVILGTWLVAAGLVHLFRRSFLPSWRGHWGEDSLRFVMVEKGIGCLLPLLMALLLEVVVLTISPELPSRHLVMIGAKLAWVWLLVRLCTAFLSPGRFSHLLSVIIYLVVVLEILGLLQPVSRFLDSFAVQIENLRLSLLNVLKSGLIAAFLILVSNFALKFLEKQLPAHSHLDPRQQVLLLKSAKLITNILIIIIILDTVGLDFYLVSIFRGAFGLGLGFGLQRVVANIFSGFVILLDKSIRPGDVLETGGHLWFCGIIAWPPYFRHNSGRQIPSHPQRTVDH